MKRRSFLNASAAAAALAGSTGGCGTDMRQQSSDQIAVSGNGTLAGKTLTELRREYRYWLFEDYLPFCDKHVVDHEYGGFMCNTDRDGTNITGNKRAWYEGRGIWVYSFLYNNIDPDPKYLDIARRSVEFVHKLDPGRGGFWPEYISREGTPIGEPDLRGYGNLFIANGFAEYSRAANDDAYFTRAKEILTDFIDHYDSPDYAPEAARGSLGTNAPLIPGARVMGVWMVLIRLTSQMLGYRDDPEIRVVNDRCVEAIMRHHFNPEFDLLNELLNHDMSRPINEISQLVTAHAIETLWMVMYEAVRRTDKEMFFTAAEWFRRHVEVFWDDVYGGVYHTLRHVNNNDFTLNKVLWAQVEVLIGFLCIVEHMGEQWAKDRFGKMYTYVLDTYPLDRYGYSIWNLAADRKVTFVPHYTRVGNFHNPRHLMLNLLAIERMIVRGGQISNHFT